jgi:hypothetical protein
MDPRLGAGLVTQKGRGAGRLTRIMWPPTEIIVAQKACNPIHEPCGAPAVRDASILPIRDTGLGDWTGARAMQQVSELSNGVA